MIDSSSTSIRQDTNGDAGNGSGSNPNPTFKIE